MRPLVTWQVTVPVTTIETYTVTEYRQEPYVETESYVVSSTPRSKILYSSTGPSEVIDAEGLSGLLLMYRERGTDAGFADRAITPNIGYHCLYQKHEVAPPAYIFLSIGCTGMKTRNHRVVLEWRTLVLQDELAGGVVLFEYVDIAGLRSLSPVEKADVPLPKVEPSGRIEYKMEQHPDMPFFIGVVNSAGKGYVNHPVKCEIKITWLWDEATLGERDKIVYRDVPIQVEKRRSITNYEKTTLLKFLLTPRE